MYQRMFTIYDKKAAAYLPPFFMRTNAEAVRAVQSSANDPKSNLGRYPTDFQLIYVGDWDDLTGVVKPESHQVIAEVNDLVQVQSSYQLDLEDVGR